MPEITRKPLSWFKVNPQVRKTFERRAASPPRRIR